MQNLSKHQQLVGLGLDLYTLGQQVEGARARVAALAGRGGAGDARELAAACRLFQAYSRQFAALEQQYQALRRELRSCHEA